MYQSVRPHGRAAIVASQRQVGRSPIDAQSFGETARQFALIQVKSLNEMPPRQNRARRNSAALAKAGPKSRAVFSSKGQFNE